MQLRVLLPFRLFLLADGVTQVVAVTPSGSFGLLPHRLDCVAALSPGILSYRTSAGDEVHLAIDAGVLRKTGAEVVACVREAVGGTDLGKLRQSVERQFLRVSEQEKSVRVALAHMESGFIRRFVELQRA